MFPFAYFPQDIQSSFNFCQLQYSYPWFYAYSQYGNFANNNLLEFPQLNCQFSQPQIHNSESKIITLDMKDNTSQLLNRILQNEPIEIPTSLDHNQSSIFKNPETVLNKRKKKKNKKSKIFKKGHWTNKEHRLYLQFIEGHKDIMSDSDQKRMKKIFKQMSDFIKSRSASQCRSHHQKFDTREFSNLLDVKNQNELKNQK